MPNTSTLGDPVLASAADAPFASAPGKIAALVRATDWSATPLGAIATWPQSLRSALDLVLNAGHPMYLAWGPSLHFFFNDAYLTILGAKANNPADVLGKPFSEVWADVWDNVRDMVHNALAGTPTWLESHPFVLERNGYPEQVYVSFSVSPVHDETGKAAGVFCACVETTASITANRERDRALGELAASVEKLRIATDAAEIGLFDHDWHSGSVAWSNHTKAHFGLPPDATVTETTFFNALHPEDRPRVEAEIDALLASGTRQYENEYRTIGLTDGIVRWIAARGHLYFDSDGTPLRLTGATIDITRRKQAEERERQAEAQKLAAAESNAKFRAFFEQGSYFAGVMALDGTLVEANHVALESSGFSRDEVIGKKFWDCGWWKPSPELVDMVRAGCMLAASGHTFQQETYYYVADGSKRYLELVIAPVTDDNGRMLFIAPTGVDITERKLVEERLRLLDAMSQATREAADPKVVMVETPRLLGEYLNVTRCAYADVEQDNDRFTIRHDWTAPGVTSSVGVYSLDLFGPRAAADMRTGHILVIRDVDRELAPHEGGDMFNAIGVKAIICCPLVKQGRLVAMMAVHEAAPRNWSEEDVALVAEVVERSWAHIERVRATEVLREADRRKTEFLATLAHELRNPLAPIQTGLDLMRLSGDSPGAVSKVRGMMERQLAHMVHLVDDLLDISRITRGQIELKKKTMEVKAVVASAVETSLPLIEAGCHTLVLDMPDEALLFEADPTRLTQVISNLLNNSAKYTPNGGRIVLKVRQDGNEIVITVADNGIGIPADSLTAVFDMFAQVGAHTQRAQGGLGIGLTLVQRLAELHGGSVRAESPGPGKGSTFTVRLPATSTEGGINADSEHALRDSGSSLRLLIADDNTDAAESLAMLLELDGHVTRLAHNGREALHIAQAYRPHVIFLDIGMPGMNGHETARAIRSLDGMQKTVLVAVTGWGAEADRARSKEAGMDWHLTKPAQLDQVKAILAAVKSG